MKQKCFKHHTPSYWKNQKGSTLIDSMLSILLIGFSIFGGIYAIQNSLVSSLKSEDYIIAELLANEKLEMIIGDKALSNDHYNAIIAENYPIETIYHNDNVNYKFTRKIIIQEVSESDLSTPESDSGYKKVTVKVSWAENSKHIKMATILSDLSNDPSNTTSPEENTDALKSSPPEDLDAATTINFYETTPLASSEGLDVTSHPNTYEFETNTPDTNTNTNLNFSDVTNKNPTNTINTLNPETGSEYTFNNATYNPRATDTEACIMCDTPNEDYVETNTETNFINNVIDMTSNHVNTTRTYKY